jgi:protein O-GlcNAc transferase
MTRAPAHSTTPRSLSAQVPAIARGVALHRQGRLSEAEPIYRSVLAADPSHLGALHFLGVLKLQQQRPAEALELLRKAASLDRMVLPTLAAAFAALERHEEALAIYDTILKSAPMDCDAGYNRGVMLSRLGRHEDAFETYDRVLAQRPDHAPAWFNRGNIAAMLGRFDDAIRSYERALAFAPHHLDALANRGDALKALGRHHEAIAAYEEVLRKNPRLRRVHNNRGNALFALRRYGEAVSSFQAALALDADDPEILFNLGRALQELERDCEAIAAFDRLLRISPQHADACYSRGNSLLKVGCPQDAAAAYRDALAFDPAHSHAFAGQLRAACAICDWETVARLADDLELRLANGKAGIEPLQLMSLPTSPAIQLACARACVHRKTAHIPAQRACASRRHEKIRLAYLSADFGRHVVGTVIPELLELHDRERFELLGFSFGLDDGSDIRARIGRAFDRFYDVHALSDAEFADVMRENEVDIAVDLMGHTRQARIEILAHRPAPIQVSYLGYPGTTGADFIDYILADEIVAPAKDQPFFSEKIVQLPDCYLPNDVRQREIAERIPARRELGLPEQGFVFCAFTQNYKITASMFEIWMRLLRAVEGSVLWLAQSTDMTQANLLREAKARGVEPSRLIFAPRVERMTEHLARQRRADLYLDTLPYNAHTTAANALCAGLPVLTCKGDTFASRVCASVLTAAGLPELVTSTLAHYEALAVRLASQDSLLQSLQRRLEAGRADCALFDTHRLCRNVERAYATMWEIYRRGEPARGFRVGH